jgi:6-phosphogluconolactonase
MRHRQLIGGITAIGAAIALTIPGVVTAHEGARGFVYTETNAAGGNAVLAYQRGPDGGLSAIGSFATGGLGSGGGLGSQGALTLAGNGGWLLAVNAGSNDVSTFRVREDGSLVLTDRTNAAGTDPISVTTHDGVAYVLDAGGAGNIAGFRIDHGGLRYLGGSWQPLSGSGTNPAEVGFSTDGRFLVVTERATNLIDTYRVDDQGRAGAPTSTASSGPVPYGFAFDRHDHPIVSEAANSTLSSYRLGAGGATVISASLPTGGLAACWVAVSPNGRWAFDANAHGGTVSSFAVGGDGSISLAHSVAASTGAGSLPLDLGVSSDGRSLYVIEAGAHALGGYAIGAGGTLVAIPGAPVLPAGTSGIAVS